MDQANKNKILVVDDEKINRMMIAAFLEVDYHLIMASNFKQAIERAKKHQPDLILLDIVMPECSGYEVLEQLKNDPSTEHLSVIFLTALNSEEEEEKGLSLGAVDYITKPFRLSIIKARLKIHMELINQRRVLEDLTNVDGLTNIANRRCFDDFLDREWSRCQRSQSSLAVAMIDIDYFKLYNDNYGHAEGDRVIKEVASILSKATRRKAELCARYGGEEFAIVMPDTCIDDAKALSVLCRQAVIDQAIIHGYSNASDIITVSVGVAAIIPDRTETKNTLLKLSDNNLYLAKEAGRNCVV